MPSSSQLRAGPYFLSLIALLALLYTLVFFTGDSNTPKLGLDLRGGTQVTLKADQEGGGAPSTDSLETARRIIEDRVNGRGVAGSTVVTEGDDRIVISMPGSDPDQASGLGTTAKLFFRPTLAGPLITGEEYKKQLAQQNNDNSNNGNNGNNGSGDGNSNGDNNNGNTGDGNNNADNNNDNKQDDQPQGFAPESDKTDPAQLPTDQNGNQVPQELVQYLTKSCDQLAEINSKKPADKAILACNQDGDARYAMAPSIIAGTEVKDASAQFGGGGGSTISGWSVGLTLKGDGQSTWSDYTSKHNVNATPNDIANLVGFVLDGVVLGDSPPEIQNTINGDTQITGDYNQESADALANNLKYGALPLSFETARAQNVSATLGDEQLRAGLIAGGIGLVLVVIYSMIYYRLLGIVTIASLLVSGALVYGAVVLLGQYLDLSLSLAGIAGFIVAIGITADSFIVFFERIKEEVHAGRTMRSGIPRAWTRARRTILSADAVSLLGAAVLYYLAAGEVRGFAFTLGLSTALDLIVVFLFTHPLVSVLARSKTFSSPRFSGVGAVQKAFAEEHTATAASGKSAVERAAERRASVARES